MAIEQQMEMFGANPMGGLDDDGMSRDPVSGNEIPPGSMANEVRDDVDAKLSDGEYVVPANVVRFFGVKFFEDLRTQAMQGLGAMEANGRIGGEPVPSAMPMQDQMAQMQPEVSEEDMQMLQSMMNEGGYVQGYEHGGLHEAPDYASTAYNPDQYPLTSNYGTPGGTYFNSLLNPNAPTDPNEPPPTTMPVDQNPESGINFVTMVNPSTGEIQMVQFMGGDPVDEEAYNQLINSGFFIQGSPALAQYKQKVEQDNRESDKPPERDSAGRLVTRPSPKGASIVELAQLISESSKGGSSILGSIPSLMGAVQSKAATGYQDQITKTLAERIANPDLAVHEVKALQALQDIWTNADLSKKDRVKAVAKTLLYVSPSTGNMLGKKKGEFGSKNWFGYATDDQIEDLFGDTPFERPEADAKRKADLATSFAVGQGKGSREAEAAEAKRVADYNAVRRRMNDGNEVTLPAYTPDKVSNKPLMMEDRYVEAGDGGTAKQRADFKKDFIEAGGTWASGGRAKGGLIKKPTKKKTKTKKY